jgi:hypothetical protein
MQILLRGSPAYPRVTFFTITGQLRFGIALSSFCFESHLNSTILSHLKGRLIRPFFSRSMDKAFIVPESKALPDLIFIEVIGAFTLLVMGKGWIYQTTSPIYRIC